MKNKREIIGIFLIYAIMAAFGLAFNQEKDRGYLPFMIFMAFVTLMFFLVKISQSDWKRRQKTVFFFFASFAEMLWLGWLGVTLSWQFTLGFMAAICVAWFFINLGYIYLHQRRVISRWNAAYTVWKSGGSAENYLKEMEQNQECLALLKSIQPKIKNPEVQKALLELETEISKMEVKPHE